MTSVSKNVYIDKLDDTQHTTIKMKPSDVKDNTDKVVNDKILNLKLAIM